ncbi:MAG: phosphatidate cytidylyltransferase [Pseudomonadota bacterium]
MNEKNRNLLVRVISVVLLVPPLILLVLWQKAGGFAIAVHLVSTIALMEFYQIAVSDISLWKRTAGTALGTLTSITMYWCPKADILVALLLLIILMLSTLQLFTFDDIKKATTSTAIMVFGIIYVPLMLTTIALLKKMPDGTDWVFLVLTVTWFSDTGAYFMGRAIGRHKLYVTVSPGKTVEGAFGGIVASFGAAILAKYWYMPQLTWLHGIAFAVFGSVFAQVGDLVESMVKRSFDVKDSGRIIPGHGGLLDRIDALLFVSPFFYLYVTYLF